MVCARGWTSGQDYWNGVTEDTHGGVRVHRVGLCWSQAPDPNVVLYQSDLAEEWFADYLRHLRPDVVHVTSAATLGLGVLRAAHQAGIALVLTLMDFWFLCARTVLARTDGQLCDGRTTPWDCQRCLLSSSNLFRRLSPWLPGRSESFLWGDIVCRTPFLARLPGARGMALDMGHRKRLMAEALEWPDVILSHSRVVQTMFAAAELSTRVKHLPNGHDWAGLESCKQKTRSSVVRVGFMGQITAIKGVHTLVSAFVRAGLEGRATLDMWGELDKDLAYAAGLRKLIDGHDGISLRGPFDRTGLPAVLAQIDVLVVPSNWYENAPLVIQEAFATRTPVIATNLGGMAEAVRHGRNGLLFDQDDVDDLARQLTRVVGEPDLLSALASGIPTVKTSDEEVQELEHIYGELVAGGTAQLVS